MYARSKNVVAVALALAGLVAAGTAVGQTGSPPAAPQAKPAAPRPAAKAAAPPATDLAQAYKREYAFLEAERSNLQKRLKELEAEAERRVRAAKQEVERLQGEILDTSVQSDRLNQLLTDSDRQVERLQEGTDVVDSLLAQASSRLEKGNVKLPEASAKDVAAKIAQLQFVFDRGTELLGRQATIRREPGSFYAPDGTKLDGTVVKLGQIAAYGLAGAQGGPLAPAGEGRLKIWPTEGGADRAKALIAGTLPGDLPVFLYDSLEKTAEEKQSRTFVEYTTAGGVIAWVIAALGGLALLLMLGRVVLLLRASGNTDRLLDRVTPLVAAGQIERAAETARTDRTALGRVLTVALDNVRRSREQLEDAVSEAMLRENGTLDRFGAAILISAAVGPLLGLLGTVTGMISTFDVITEYGTGNPKMLSGGISEALITTEYGLYVAIPCLLIGNVLNGWAERIKDDMERSALRVANVANGVEVRSFRRRVVVPAGAAAGGAERAVAS